MCLFSDYYDANHPCQCVIGPGSAATEWATAWKQLFYSPLLNLKTIFKIFGRKNNAFNVLRHFSYLRCRWKTRNIITILSCDLFIPSALHEYCNSKVIVRTAGSLLCSSSHYYFLPTAADNLRRQASIIMPQFPPSLLLCHSFTIQFIDL